MVSVDLRSRRDGQSAASDPVVVLDEILPTAWDEQRDLLAATDWLRLRPLALTVRDDTQPGLTWRLERCDGVLRCERGVPAESDVRLELTTDDCAHLIDDQLTPISLMTSGRLRLDGGQIGHFLDWWLALRSALDGVEVYRPGAVEVDEELGRSFRLGDPEAGEFLARNGFVHLDSLFSAGEMAAISAEMDAAAPSYSQGDGASWWATLDDGSDALVRMQRFDERSPSTADLIADERFLALGGLVDDGHMRDPDLFNRAEALFKPLGVSQGISDIPWHKDCSLGRHSYDCCGLTVGVSVTGAGEGTGQLRVAAGTHRAMMWPSLVEPEQIGFRDVALPTGVGDVTVHLSCTMHRAEPPTTAPRRVIYTSFRLPPPDAAAAAAARQNRALLGAARESAPLTSSQPAANR